MLVVLVVEIDKDVLMDAEVEIVVVLPDEMDETPAAGV